MKRNTDITEKQRGSNPGRNQTKRSKSAQACASCRKLKTRCELLDASSDGPYRCHRCKVLNISCSFEDLDIAPARPHHSPTQPVIPQSPGSADNRENANIQRQSSSSSLKGTSFSKNRVDPMKPDVLPQPPNISWPGLVKVPGGPFDWMAAPMFAMQNITSRMESGEDLFMADVNTSLANILGPDRLKSLLNIFESRYSPWLNLQPHRGGINPLITLARCTVASRHLDSVTCASIFQQLQKLTEETIYRQVFNPTPSIPSIEAIQILALWSPPGHGEARDGRLLIASAISMAMNLRLNKAVEHAAWLYGLVNTERTNSMADLDGTIEKARLWLSLVNVESMYVNKFILSMIMNQCCGMSPYFRRLCIGTGRALLPHRTSLDRVVIGSSSCATVGSGRDVRLALMGQILELAESGLRIYLPSKLDIDKFYQDVIDVLIKSDELQVLISALPESTEHEVFYFHFLEIFHNAYRLLFLHHCLRNLRRVVQDDSGRSWFLLTDYNGVNLGAKWGQEAMELAEKILSSALSQPELKQLSTAPDIIFALLCFAAVFLVICKISTYQDFGAQLPASSDTLLTLITDRLLQVACGPDHAPAKCARLISALVKGFKALSGGDQASMPHAHGNSSGPPQTLSVEGQPQPDLKFPTVSPGVDFIEPAIPSAMLDHNYWTSFMDTLMVNIPYEGEI
ncbi:hypothetical protein PILCRDRAFT_689319 [Piloderma croceum F 1598]|uniref:Zn(2)-C6 fungal-type domain-containing protein n=1 Tax=Piloderma croceum (strain F 1598) TaxID=765440 RepID=A0A0C3F527_PILCF|nr:hypothetical protein PILCRDRAFT_689319 [Piloderma croceum F 1598]